MIESLHLFETKEWDSRFGLTFSVLPLVSDCSALVSDCSALGSRDQAVE